MISQHPQFEEFELLIPRKIARHHIDWKHLAISILLNLIDFNPIHKVTAVDTESCDHLFSG